MDPEEIAGYEKEREVLGEDPYTYVMGEENVSGRAMVPKPFVLGKTYTASAGVTPLGLPINNTVTALDSRTNKIVWQHETPGAATYGMVSTAGGVVFNGQPDGNLVAIPYVAAPGV